MRIVRNFQIIKCVLFFPTRFCLNKIGPLLSSLIARHSSKKKGADTTHPINESTKSIPLFIYGYILKHPFFLYRYHTCLKSQSVTHSALPFPILFSVRKSVRFLSPSGGYFSSHPQLPHTDYLTAVGTTPHPLQ